MYYLNDFCCICLCNNKILQQLSTTDNDNITYLSKIISSIPEMNYSIMNNKRLLCKDCCDNLNITYKFRQQCLRSKTMTMDYISQLRSISNVSGKISICLTDFRLQQDESCVILKDKRAIDTLNLVNEINTEQSEGHFIDVNCLQMEEVFKEDGRLGADCIANPLHIEVKNEIETNIDSANQIKYSRVLFDNQEKELINKSKVNLNDQKNSENELYLDKISSTNFNIKVCVESKIKNKVVNENFNSINGIKTELNEINVFDNQLTEELVIKTEDENNGENYIDENNDFSFDGELNRNKTVKNCSYECTLCKTEFSQSDVLETHMKVHAAEQYNVCTICNKIFADDHVLSEHMKTHTEKQRHECSICKQSFHYLSKLNRHLKSHKGAPYKCTVCKETFIQLRHLKKHLGTHAIEQQYECTVCKKNFVYLSALKTHTRTHTGERPYACTICNKTFSYNGVLTSHMRTHTGERPYECTICKIKYLRVENLKKHMRTHTGERPNECTICKKTFYWPDHLNFHMRTHAVERPYECTVCKKAFTQSDYLNIHMRIHTGERPFECTVCNKKLVSSNALCMHMIFHTGKRPHECETCNKTFILRAELEKHMKTHTGK